MNILVFGEAAWDDKNSFGNTVSNFLCGDAWKHDRFFDFYARKQMPDNKADVSYYNLSAIDIVKGMLRLRIEGRSFSSDTIQNEKKEFVSAHINEQRNIDRLHQNKNEFIYFGHELIWRSRVWLNQYFDRFIRKASPDILFAFATSPFILWPLIQYLKRHTTCKIVLLISDDVYGSYNDCVFYRKRYLKQEFRNCILSADKLYAISDEMSELYGKQFGRPITTLYKGCDLSLPLKKELNQPLRFVYAGNLLWGRDDTLALVAKSLEKLNETGQKAILEIYTGATITAQLQQKLNRGISSRIMGVRPYEEIKGIMQQADVVLHVESFDEKAIETVRYSFSTKIIDCLQSGAQVLGIGPKGIASIEYLRKVDGAIVIDVQSDIQNTVEQIIHKQDKINLNIVKTRAYAREHHEIERVQQSLRKEFEEILQ